MTLYQQCQSCKYCFIDQSVGYWECTIADNLSDEEYEEYCDDIGPIPCPHFVRNTPDDDYWEEY